MTDEQPIDETAIQEMVNEAMVKFLAAEETAHRVPPPTVEQEIAERLNTARFRKQMADHALAAGVRPSSVRHVLRDAAEVFEMQDYHLVPRQGQTDPGDPLAPLSPRTWLRLLQQSDPYLFLEGQTP